MVSGLSRYMNILRLFDELRSEWTISDMATSLATPASTVYRTVREMVAGQLLEPSTEAHYRLGACFIEFDRLVRVTDPLYWLGTTILREVALQARIPCQAVLARLYGDTVMCVAEASTADNFQTSFERGRPRPLTRGATSKVILARLPGRRLSRLLAQVDAERAPFDASADDIRSELAAIRKRGYSVTRGEVDKGLVGIAAPVAIPESAVLGSISLVVEAARLDDALERRLVLLVVSSASLLMEQVPRPGSKADGARAIS